MFTLPNALTMENISETNMIYLRPFLFVGHYIKLPVMLYQM